MKYKKYYLAIFFFWKLHSNSTWLIEGGQRLIDLAANGKAMRLKTVQNLLYPVNFRPWVSFALALLRKFGGFCFDRQLLL